MRSTQGAALISGFMGNHGCEAWVQAEGSSFHPGTTGEGETGSVNVGGTTISSGRRIKARGGSSSWSGQMARPGRVTRIPSSVTATTDRGTWSGKASNRSASSTGSTRTAPAREDLAYALEYVVPFRGDVECLRWLRYPAPPSRRRRLERFAEAYGLTSTDGLVDQVIAVQRAGLDLVSCV